MIEHQTGPVSFLLELTDGRERRWHLDQVRKCTVHVEVPPETPDVDLSPELPAASESELPIPIGNSCAVSTEMLEVAPTTPTAVFSQQLLPHLLLHLPLPSHTLLKIGNHLIGM